MSTWSGGATVGLLGATVVTPPLAPVTVPLAGFTESVSTGTGLLSTGIECVDGGPWGACGMGVIATAAPGLSNKSLGWVAKQFGDNAERAARAGSNLLGVVLGNTGNTH